MKYHSHQIKNQSYRQAFARLDEALAENTQTDNYEKIRLMRLALFADVDKLQQSGRIIIPK
jgi:hypothetical protein